jgi:hypothetical protein
MPTKSKYWRSSKGTRAPDIVHAHTVLTLRWHARAERTSNTGERSTIDGSDRGARNARRYSDGGLRTDLRTFRRTEQRAHAVATGRPVSTTSKA